MFNIFHKEITFVSKKILLDFKPDKVICGEVIQRVYAATFHVFFCTREKKLSA